MKKFIVTNEEFHSQGFQTHVNVNILRPVEEQLHRRRMLLRTHLDDNERSKIKEIINWNSSLRIDFGWAFESDSLFQQLMDRCHKLVYTDIPIVSTISDLRCSWIGFVPFNSYDREYYADFNTIELINFNNRLINFQIDLVNEIVKDPVFKQHAFHRDDNYRYNYSKTKRKNPEELYRLFDYCIESYMYPYSIPQKMIEEQIGMHYLHYPEIFFEMVEFYKLKGIISNEE